MRPGWPSLAILLAAGAAAGGATLAAADEVVVYRCVDAAGRVTLQGQPCPAGSQETRMARVRPQDPPPNPPAPATTPAPAPEPPPVAARPAPPRPSPPTLYQCTDFDGQVRDSEVYDPNPRCVPLAILGYDLRDVPPERRAVCRWVRDSCVRLDDAAACRRYEAKLGQARSDALHAFSDTAEYRKSEVRRLQQIVDDSCR